MAYKTNISIGAPPILWSNVQQAFDEINQNFLELGVVVGSALDLEPLSFTSLESSVSPNTSNEFNLGSASKTWKSLYVAEWFDIPGNQLNGVWLGDAQIRGTGTTVDLPENSTVDGELIINPAHTSFKTIAVPTQSNIVADSFTDTLNITSTTGISLITDATTDTLTIGNSGVRSIQGSTYIGVSATTGDNITLTNQGVTNLTAGPGISVNQSTGGVQITNSGIRGITAGGGGITVFIDGNNVASITNTAPVTRSFATIRVPGQTDLEADITSDILQIHPGYGINLTTSEPIGESERLTIAFDNKVDIVGSVFADDSTILVDAVSGTLRGIFIGSVFTDNSTQIIDGNTATVYGNIEATTLRTADLEIALGDNAGLNQAFRAVAVGALAGSEDQGTRAVAIGNQAGQYRQSGRGVAIGASSGFFEQGDSAVAIGDNAGQSNQGDYAIAVGYYAGHNNQSANSIILNASSSILNGAAAGFYVNPVRSTTSSARPVVYDTTTKELFYTSTLEFINSTISTNDSSGITVDVQTTFNTNINVDNDIQLTSIQSSIRGTDKIKFVPSNADELSYNVRLDVYSESTIEPRLALDTPDGVDLTLSSGMAGIVISKINGRVNLAAGNNAFIVRENGSWAMTPLTAAPLTPTVGVYIADCTNWDPASKSNGRPYPVWYDGASFNALY